VRPNEGADPGAVTVVTGASSGIGRCTAQLFAAQGDRVVLAARRAERLEQVRDELARRGHEALVVPTDLTLPGQAEALITRTVERWGRIDVLVNNAGYGTQCRFDEMPDEEVARMFTVNVLSAMALSRAAVGIMRQQGSGSIVNVASVGGVVAHPLNVAYCASKHALVGFSKSLRLELKGTGVRVSAVCPGATRTEFFDVAEGEIPFDEMIEKYSAPPQRVARAILKASRKNRALVFPTWSAWLLYFADRWLPWLSQAGNIRYRDKVLSRRRPA
jgi:short-subunit dehydrogenase